MRKSAYWAIWGFLFTSILGTLLHFAFEWSGNMPVIGLVSAVNESIWEHMKLIFYPMAACAVIQYRFGQGRGEGYWCEKLVSILITLTLIPVIYYTYTGILGTSADWFNIAIFFISAGIAYRSEAIRFQKGRNCPLSDGVAGGLIAVIALLFVVFTFFPPKIPLFADPRTGAFGYVR